MKKRISLLLIVLVFIVSLCSCSNGNNNIPLKDNSKVLATVGDVNITQQQLDSKKLDSTYSGQVKVFTDKEVLDDMIDEQLLLIKAKEFNIEMSDTEVIKNYKGMLEAMSSRQYVKGDENKIDKKGIEGLRNIFLIQKTKEKLSSDIDITLKQLRQQVKIKYYS